MSRHEDYDERFGELARLSYQVAFRLTGDRHEAEDHAQEALTRAYLKWPRMHGHAEAWVVRVTTNLVIGRWRRLGRRSPEATDPSPGADHGMAERIALTVALRALPRRQREVAALRFLGDLSIEQTAEALGCTPGTVKQHTARALTSLRAHPELRGHLDAVVDEPPASQASSAAASPSSSGHSIPPSPHLVRRSTDVP